MSDFAWRLKNADIGSITLSSDWRVTGISPSAVALLGARADKLVGRPILDIHDPEARMRVELLLKQAEAARQSAASMMVPFPGRTLHVRVCPMLTEDSYPGSAESPPEGAPPQTHGYTVILLALEEEGSAALSAASAPPVAGNGTAGQDGESAASSAAASAMDPSARFLLKLPVENGTITSFIEPQSVYYVTAEGHYSRIVATTGSHFCNLSLAELEKRLDPALFFRPHRSWLVNLSHVTGFSRRNHGGELVMARPEGHLVPVSRSRVQDLKELLAV